MMVSLRAEDTRVKQIADQFCRHPDRQERAFLFGSLRAANGRARVFLSCEWTAPPLAKHSAFVSPAIGLLSQETEKNSNRII